MRPTLSVESSKDRDDRLNESLKYLTIELRLETTTIHWMSARCQALNDTLWHLVFFFKDEKNEVGRGWEICLRPHSK